MLRNERDVTTRGNVYIPVDVQRNRRGAAIRFIGSPQMIVRWWIAWRIAKTHAAIGGLKREHVYFPTTDYFLCCDDPRADPRVRTPAGEITKFAWYIYIYIYIYIGGGEGGGQKRADRNYRSVGWDEEGKRKRGEQKQKKRTTGYHFISSAVELRLINALLSVCCDPALALRARETMGEKVVYNGRGGEKRVCVWRGLTWLYCTRRLSFYNMPCMLSSHAA